MSMDVNHNPTAGGHALTPPSSNGHQNGFKPIVIESDPTRSPSDGNDGIFKRPAAKYGEDYWELGWTDGRLGQPLDQTTLQWRTEVERIKKLTELRAQIAEARTKIASITARIGWLPRRIDELRDYQHKLRMVEYKDNFRASIPLGLLYSLIGFILFIADLPLSLTLVAQALKIPTKVGDVSVDYIFRHPLDVIFGGPWQAVFLAGGIAFSGMFVKYYLDEVLFPEKNWDLPNNDSAPKHERPRLRFAVFTLIFILFFGTTIALGVFRASVKPATAEQTNVERLNSETTNTATEGPTASGAGESNSWFSWLPLESGTFTLLTLMFPIVGGVCFSAGSRRLADGCRRLKRAIHYHRIGLSITWLSRRYNPLENSLAAKQTELSRLQELLSQAEDEQSTEAAKQLNLHLYKHGYQRGCSLPETLHVDTRLYPQARRIVDKFLARDLRARVWQGIDQNGNTNNNHNADA